MLYVEYTGYQRKHVASRGKKTDKGEFKSKHLFHKRSKPLASYRSYLLDIVVIGAAYRLFMSWSGRRRDQGGWGEAINRHTSWPKAFSELLSALRSSPTRISGADQREYAEYSLSIGHRAYFEHQWALKP
jgi:hypothetical protein